MRISWLRLVYGVVARKFGDPAFQGIVERLDYLKELGADALWLSPINRSPEGDYGYAVVDYFDLNPDFGAKDDLILAGCDLITDQEMTELARRLTPVEGFR